MCYVEIRVHFIHMDVSWPSNVIKNIVFPQYIGVEIL